MADKNERDLGKAASWQSNDSSDEQNKKAAVKAFVEKTVGYMRYARLSREQMEEGLEYEDRERVEEIVRHFGDRYGVPERGELLEEYKVIYVPDDRYGLMMVGEGYRDFLRGFTSMRQMDEASQKLALRVYLMAEAGAGVTQIREKRIYIREEEKGNPHTLRHEILHAMAENERGTGFAIEEEPQGGEWELEEVTLNKITNEAATELLESIDYYGISLEELAEKYLSGEINLGAEVRLEGVALFLLMLIGATPEAAGGRQEAVAKMAECYFKGNEAELTEWFSGKQAENTGRYNEEEMSLMMRLSLAAQGLDRYAR